MGLGLRQPLPQMGPKAELEAAVMEDELLLGVMGLWTFITLVEQCN